MRLNRTLTIDGTALQVVNEKVRLQLNGAGSAIFTVVASNIKLHSLVTFDVGYAKQAAAQRFFIGVVVKVNPIGNKQSKVYCKELSHALAFKLPLDLRHVSLTELLAKITELTRLEFAVPDEPYANTKTAKFFNLGSGVQAIEAISKVFKVPDCIWQQQAGTVYVGRWADSRWAAVDDLILPNKLFDKQGPDNATLAAIPQLRPGIRVNGQRLQSVTFQQNTMVITWNA